MGLLDFAFIGLLFLGFVCGWACDPNFGTLASLGRGYSLYANSMTLRIQGISCGVVALLMYLVHRPFLTRILPSTLINLMPLPGLIALRFTVILLSAILCPIFIVFSMGAQKRDTPQAPPDDWRKYL